MNTPIDLLSYYNPWSSEAQMECTTLRDTGLTEYGIFKQALREMMPCFQSLLRWKETHGNHIKNTGNLVADEFEEALYKHAVQQELRKFRFFYGVANIMKARLGDLSDPRRIEQLERELYIAQIERNAYLEIISGSGSISKSTLSSMFGLDYETREALEARLRDQKFIPSFVTTPVQWESPETVALDSSTEKMLNAAIHPQICSGSGK